MNLSNHRDFKKGHVHTNFIRDHHDSLFPHANISEIEKIQAALSTILNERRIIEQKAAKINDSFNPFILESNFRVNHCHVQNISIVSDKEGEKFIISCSIEKQLFCRNTSESEIHRKE